MAIAKKEKENRKQVVVRIEPEQLEFIEGFENKSDVVRLALAEFMERHEGVLGLKRKR